MTKSEIAELINQAKKEHSELVSLRAWRKADLLKSKIKLLIKKLNE